jgi:RNA polymerase sigma-70 factor (ECF subfamily)
MVVVYSSEPKRGSEQHRVETVLLKDSITSGQVYIQCRGRSETREKLFRTIWNLYQKRLTYFIRNFVKDDAEDVFQEIMLKVFENIETFSPRYSFNTWIYSIARNHCINHLGKRKSPMAPGNPESLLPASDNISSEDKVLQKELHREIDRVLGTFSEDNQQIAFLRFFEGMKHREIARIMNIPTGTVKSRLHACRTQLRDVLEAYNGR